jgi:hypothetical protein
MHKITNSATQWPAVKTVVGVMSDPPQNMVPSMMMEAILGTMPCFTGAPFTMYGVSFTLFSANFSLFDSS